MVDGSECIECVLLGFKECDFTVIVCMTWEIGNRISRTRKMPINQVDPMPEHDLFFSGMPGFFSSQAYGVVVGFCISHTTLSTSPLLSLGHDICLGYALWTLCQAKHTWTSCKVVLWCSFTFYLCDLRLDDSDFDSLSHRILTLLATIWKMHLNSLELATSIQTRSHWLLGCVTDKVG